MLKNTLTIELNIEDFEKILKTEKIDLKDNFIYLGIIEQFKVGPGLRALSSMLVTGKKVETFIFKIKGVSENEFDIKLIYSLEEIKRAFEKTKYNYGIRKQDTKLLKDYFNRNLEKKEIKKIQTTKVEENLTWIDEIRTKVNQEFITNIINSIPNTLEDNLEKIIYAYFLLCTSLKYDLSFFINRDEFESKHLNFGNISKIEKNNNEVVCYEFNMIFALLAEHFGFKSSIADLIINLDKIESIIPVDLTEEIKNDHYSLILENSEYQIYFDSTRGSLNIDLTNVKIGENINGIKNCKEDPNEYLIYKVEKIYNLFLNNNNIEKSESYKPTLSVEKDFALLKKSLKEISEGKTDFEYVDVKEKINIFFDLTKEIKDLNMDNISKIYILFKNIFNYNKEQAIFRILRTNEENPLEQKAVLLVMFKDKEDSLYIKENEEDFKQIPKELLTLALDTNKYVIFSERHNIEPLEDISEIKRGK